MGGRGVSLWGQRRQQPSPGLSSRERDRPRSLPARAVGAVRRVPGDSGSGTGPGPGHSRRDMPAGTGHKRSAALLWPSSSVTFKKDNKVR